MSEHVGRQEDAAGDLKGAKTVYRSDPGVRGEGYAAPDLKQEQCNQKRLQKLLAIDVAKRLHDRTIAVRPKYECKVIHEVQREEVGNNAERGYIPWATRSAAGAASAGGGAGMSSRQNQASAGIPSQNATHTQVSGTGSCNM